MTRKTIPVILFAIAFGLAMMPMSALADHTIIVVEDNEPVAEVYVQIAVYCEGGWQTAYGYTNENGVFTNQTLIPAIGQSYWQAVLVDPDYSTDPNPIFVNYPTVEVEMEVEGQ